MIYIVIILITLGLLYVYGTRNKEYFEIVSSNNNSNKNIIQTWKNHSIPHKYHSGIKSLKKYNPNYNFIFFSDNDIETFLKNNYPDYYKTYLLLPYKIQRIDFFRYIAVYHLGGYYFDLDISGDDNLDKINTNNNTAFFPIDMHINENNIEEARFNKYSNLGFLVGQYAFYAPKHHPFIKYLIDGIHNNIQMYISEKTNTQQYIYDTTGPDYVTKEFIKYMKTPEYKEYPVHILHHPLNQKFGQYASHNYFGTWKNIA